jgi:hypothetical protein
MKTIFKTGELNKFGFDGKNWVSKFFLGLGYTFTATGAQLDANIG